MIKNKQHFILIAMVLFLLAGSFGTRPLIPLMASELGASTAQIGMLVSLFSLLPFLLAIQIGRFLDKVGLKLPLIISSLICSFSLFLLYIFPTIEVIILSQILGGVSQTVFVVAVQSYASSLGDENGHDKAVMLFSLGAATGSFIGPLIGGITSDWKGYPFSFAVLAFVIFISFIFTFFVNEKEDTKKKEKQKQSLLQSFDLLKSSDIRRAFFVSILVLLGKDLYTAYFPLLASDFGMSDTNIGMIISVNALAGIFVRLYMPKLIAVFGRRKVITGSIVISGAFLLTIPFFQSVIILSVISFLLGLALGIGQPLSISITISALPENRKGEGLGLRLTSNRLTQLATPATFGVVAEFIGLAGIFWVAGVLILIGSMKTRIEED